MPIALKAVLVVPTLALCSRTNSNPADCEIDETLAENQIEILNMDFFFWDSISGLQIQCVRR